MFEERADGGAEGRATGGGHADGLEKVIEHEEWLSRRRRTRRTRRMSITNSTSELGQSIVEEVKGMHDTD